jgi:hypothetical protein
LSPLDPDVVRSGRGRIVTCCGLCGLEPLPASSRAGDRGRATGFPGAPFKPPVLLPVAARGGRTGDLVGVEGDMGVPLRDPLLSVLGKARSRTNNIKIGIDVSAPGSLERDGDVDITKNTIQIQK